MARWKVAPGTEGNTLSGGINYDNEGSRWSIQQDISGVLKSAKEDRDSGDGKAHYTKMYSIPDVVAIEINMKWGIDVYSPEFMHDKAMKTKVHLIIQENYPDLMSTDKRV